MESIKIYGRVRGTDGKPVEGITVEFHLKRFSMSSDELLKSAKTDGDGTYSQEITSVESMSPDILVRAFGPSGVPEEVIVLGAKESQEVNLTVLVAEVAEAELDVLTLALQNALKAENEEFGLDQLRSEAFTDADLALLSARTGIDPRDVLLIQQSLRLEADVKGSVRYPAFFALGKYGLPIGDLRIVLSLDAKRRRQALVSAVAQNRLAKESPIDEWLAALNKLAIASALDVGAESGSTIGKFMGLLKVDKSIQEAILHEYSTYTGLSLEDFWTRAEESIGAEELAPARTALQIAAITSHHYPVAMNVVEAFDLKEAADLAKLERGDWEEAVDSVPPALEAIEMSRESYIDLIEQKVEEAFPTALIKNRLDKFGAETLGGFFEKKWPDYDIRFDRISRRIETDPDLLEGEELETLKRLERTYRLAPSRKRMKAMSALHSIGFGSAHKIASMSKEVVVHALVDEGVDEDGAREIYERSRMVSSIALVLGARHHRAFQQPSLPAVAPMSLKGSLPGSPMMQITAGESTEHKSDTIPNWEELFGSIDHCACSTCESAYSPSAYLVELLDWLAGMGTGPGTPYGTLKERRPDIPELLLSCRNANTMLPQIDLVNEALERAVTGVGGHNQTLGDDADLLVHPEHMLVPAYRLLAGDDGDPLKRSEYPFHLPFDLPTEESHEYLKLVGVSRSELVQALEPLGAMPDPLMLETLKLSQKQFELITTPRTDEERVAGLWGVASIAELASVRTLLACARPAGAEQMTLDQLMQLLRSRYIQNRSEDVLPMGLWYPDALCDLNAAILTNITAGHLDRMHRFIRLQRHLGMSVAELDRAIEVLNEGAIGELDAGFLTKLAGATRLAAMLSLPPAEAISWCGMLDTVRWGQRLIVGQPVGTSGEGFGWIYEGAGLGNRPTDPTDLSFYDRLFLSRSHEADYDPSFFLTGDGTKLAVEVDEDYVPPSLLSRREAVEGALRLRSSDLDALHQRLAASSGPDPILSLENLSWLYRHASLARALHLTVREYCTLQELAGFEYLEVPTIEGAISFADMVREVRAAGMSAASIAYALRGVLAGTTTDGPDDEAVGAIVRALRETLRAIEPALDRYDDLVDSAIVDCLATESGLSIGVVRPVVSTYLRVVKEGSQSEPLLAAFRRLAAYPADAPEAAEAQALGQMAYRIFHRAGVLLGWLGVGPGEIEWLCTRGPDHDGLDISVLSQPPAMPAEAGDTLAERFKGWRTLAGWRSVRDRFMGGRFLDVLENLESGVEAALIHERILERTSWDRAQYDEVCEVLGVTADSSLLYDPVTIERMAECLRLARRTGLSVKRNRTLCSYGDFDARMRAASEAKQAARAQFGEERWREIALPLRNRLRERQRDALVGWLVGAEAKFRTGPDALAQHLLLDVDMSACQLTSRIVQATNSVQLFVQRVLLNLEPNIHLASSDVRQWNWLKNYRVWEANRKVFLYPENFIEPELRDDKTPFFEEFENELMQAELTDESAERAVLNYIEKVVEVAQLEVAGLLEEEANDGRSIVHIFGRTPTTPHRYFYRKRIDQSIWTPWEAVPVEIDGDHLIPAVFKGRLHLFWPVFGELTGKPNLNKRDGSTPPPAYHSIGLAWTELRSGRWLPKKVSKQRIGEEADGTPTADVKEALLKKSFGTAEYSFRTELTGDLLIRPVVEGKHLTRHYQVSGADGSVEVVTGNASAAKPMVSNGKTIWFQGFKSGPGPLELSSSFRDYKIGVLGSVLSSFRITTPDIFAPGADHTFVFQDRSRVLYGEPSSYRTQRVPEANPGSIIIPGEREQHTYIDPMDLVTSIEEEVSRPYTFVGRPEGLFAEENLDMRALLSDSRTELVDGVAKAVSSERYSVGSMVTFMSQEEHVGASASGMKAFAASTGRSKIAAFVLGGSQFNAGTNRAIAELQFQQNGHLTSSGHEHPSVGEITVVDKIRLHAFYHPFTNDLLRQLHRFGLDGLYDPETHSDEFKLGRQKRGFDFIQGYVPQSSVAEEYPRDEYDFDGGAYEIYNWELFFHIPFMIAVQLHKNRKFEAAQRWFHFVFNPTEPANEDSSAARYWKIKPFYELFEASPTDKGPIQEALLLLHDHGGDTAKLYARERLNAQIALWRADPFDPHAIARLRLVTYQKAVVMRYLDTLIDWGDDLFRQDTRESINEAVTLYLFAAELLGRRPQSSNAPVPTPESFETLYDKLDDFGNAMVQLEGYLQDMNASPAGGGDAPVPIGRGLFFCVPANDKLELDYWDRVADRLFKIRHCQNLEGVARQLALFAPPIDPALLVRATAAGLDIGEVLSGEAAVPEHRFQVIHRKAIELCSDVRGLGSALLSALEKKDAEYLQLLRSSHEGKLHAAMRQVRELQIDESAEAIEALKKSKEGAIRRLEYYRSRPFRIESEKRQERRLNEAVVLNTTAVGLDLVSAVIAAIPNLSAGFTAGWPSLWSEKGGTALGNSANLLAQSVRGAAAIQSYEAQMAGILAGHRRRADDWSFQASVAEKEIEAFEKQIISAEIRKAIAEKELENLERQIEQTSELEVFLRDKFTNQQLYQWMVGQLSALYFQSYQLAFGMARKAEKAMQKELGLETSTYIQFGYWDGLKKGLLAGERLQLDLQRMDVAFLEQKKREYELTRHVSLRTVDPEKLDDLKRTGKAKNVRIPEALFDLDSPGHYLRRIKSVAVSIPSVAGPYTPVRCALTLISSKVRNKKSATVAGYHDEGNFDLAPSRTETVVTSRAQEDSGLFETNLQGDRLLPFEGAGVISEWNIELPQAFHSFDYETIADFVFHIRYTARQGSPEPDGLASVATEALRSGLISGTPAYFVAFSARQSFPNEWNAFVQATSEDNASLNLVLDPSFLKFGFRTATWHPEAVAVRYVGADGAIANGTQVTLEMPKEPQAVGEPPGIIEEYILITDGVGALPLEDESIDTNARLIGDWAFSLPADAGRDLLDDLLVIIRVKAIALPPATE